MENYNIQVADVEKGWEHTASKTLAFTDHKEAVQFCHQHAFDEVDIATTHA